jgi:hypothetical protein
MGILKALTPPNIKSIFTTLMADRSAMTESQNNY